MFTNAILSIAFEHFSRYAALWQFGSAVVDDHCFALPFHIALHCIAFGRCHHSHGAALRRVECSDDDYPGYIPIALHCIWSLSVTAPPSAELSGVMATEKWCSKQQWRVDYSMSAIVLQSKHDSKFRNAFMSTAFPSSLCVCQLVMIVHSFLCMH